MEIPRIVHIDGLMDGKTLDNEQVNDIDTVERWLSDTGKQENTA